MAKQFRLRLVGLIKASLACSLTVIHLWATPAAGIQTILEEITATRSIPAGTTPQRFVESRFIRELVASGFVDALCKGR